MRIKFLIGSNPIHIILILLTFNLSYRIMSFRNHNNLLFSSFRSLSLITKSLFYDCAFPIYPLRINWINTDDVPFSWLVQMVAAIISKGGIFKIDGTLIVLLVKLPNTSLNLWIILLYCHFIGVPTSSLIVHPVWLRISVLDAIALEIWHALRGFILSEKTRNSGCITEAEYRNVDPSYFNMDHMSYPSPKQHASLFIAVMWILMDDKEREEYAEAHPFLPRKEVIECYKIINRVVSLPKTIITDVLSKMFKITMAIRARVVAESKKDSD